MLSQTQQPPAANESVRIERHSSPSLPIWHYKTASDRPHGARRSASVGATARGGPPFHSWTTSTKRRRYDEEDSETTGSGSAKRSTTTLTWRRCTVSTRASTPTPAKAR